MVFTTDYAAVYAQMVQESNPAFALTGDATNPDPVCTLTPLRSIIDEALELNGSRPEYVYRYIEKDAVAEQAAP